jgi:hypothetical protein
LLVKLHRNLNLSGYDLKQKIEDYFVSNDSAANKSEERNRSAPA